ncbi:MAG TPA: hypothetical protein VHE35_12275 [Kofleriaceae bacterium]|nr:hypothetical protein [Kofleriaceae bacterium]
MSSRRPALPSPTLLAAVLALAALLGPAGCYDTPKPACAFACALDGSCPDGYACDTQDQICHLRLDDGTLEACPAPFLDAAQIDAGPVDAPAIDAAVDAPIDAEVDAPIDAP